MRFEASKLRDTCHVTNMQVPKGEADRRHWLLGYQPLHHQTLAAISTPSNVFEFSLKRLLLSHSATWPIRYEPLLPLATIASDKSCR